MITKPFAKNNGMALLITIIVISLLTISVLGLLHSAWLRAVFAADFRDDAQAYFAARSGHTAAKKILIEDAKKNLPSDALTEEWAQSAIPIPFGDDYAFVSIRDESGKLSINSLVSAKGYPQERLIGVFERLLEEAGLDSKLADPIVDWLDINQEPRRNGAEDGYYATLKHPYRTKNRRIDSLEELMVIKGITPEILAKLRPYVTAWSNGKININTADPKILIALDPNITNQMVVTILKARAQKPFARKEDIKRIAGMATIYPSISLMIDVKSDYFSVDSQATINQNSKTIRAVYRRSASNVTTLYYKVF